MNDNGRSPTPGSDEAKNRLEFADLIRRLRQVADRLPVEHTPQDDLKILSQTLRERLMRYLSPPLFPVARTRPPDSLVVSISQSPADSSPASAPSSTGQCTTTCSTR